MTAEFLDRLASTLDPQARGHLWLTTLLAHVGVEATVTTQHDEIAGADNYWLEIHPAIAEQGTALLADAAIALDAVQYLANITLNASLDRLQQHGYTVELGGYRHQQREALQAIATAAVEQVHATGAPYTITNLSSVERKQVHALLKAYADLETHSEGQEPHRHLVVTPRPPAASP